MQTIRLSSEAWLRFRPAVQWSQPARQAASGSLVPAVLQGTKKRKPGARLRTRKEKTVRALETGNLPCYGGGRCESRSGPEGNPAAVGERLFPFEPEAASAGVALPITAEQPAGANARNKHILIADDDPNVRGSLAAVLESEGYVVIEAGDGVQAVKRAIEYVPDLVLLDLNMPHWDGWTAFSQLERATPLLPVIVITARPNQFEMAVRLGVDAFMEKPLNIPTLVRAIKRLAGEDSQRRTRRITNLAFVTECLGSAEP
jgi:CheY-like chemotaxis protein